MNLPKGFIPYPDGQLSHQFDDSRLNVNDHFMHLMTLAFVLLTTALRHTAVFKINVPLMTSDSQKETLTSAHFYNIQMFL
jgi:hypothetical protein